MNAADEGRIPSPILDEAAEWLVRLQDSGCTDDTRQACAQWRQRSPQHAPARLSPPGHGARRPAPRPASPPAASLRAGRPLATSTATPGPHHIVRVGKHR